MRYHFLTLNCKTSTCFLSCVVEMKSVLILTLAFLACFFLEPVSSSCVFKQTRVALYNLLNFTLTTDHAFNTQERANILSCGLIYRIVLHRQLFSCLSSIMTTPSASSFNACHLKNDLKRNFKLFLSLCYTGGLG